MKKLYHLSSVGALKVRNSALLLLMFCSAGLPAQIKENTDPIPYPNAREITVPVYNEAAGSALFRSSKFLPVGMASGAIPLMLVNGKEEKYGNWESIGPSKIKSIKVLKGEKAVKKYGDRAKEGVILIKTRQKDLKISQK